MTATPVLPFAPVSENVYVSVNEPDSVDDAKSKPPAVVMSPLAYDALAKELVAATASRAAAAMVLKFMLVLSGCKCCGGGSCRGFRPAICLSRRGDEL